MGRKKIAPRTKVWLSGKWCEWEPLAKEVRALLAVARAAKRCANDYDEESYGLHAALARLERAGKEEGR